MQTVSPDEHPYHDDPVLPGLLKRLLPARFVEKINVTTYPLIYSDSVRGAVESDLGRLGQDLIHSEYAPAENEGCV